MALDTVKLEVVDPARLRVRSGTLLAVSCGGEKGFDGPMARTTKEGSGKFIMPELRIRIQYTLTWKL